MSLHPRHSARRGSRAFSITEFVIAVSLFILLSGSAVLAARGGYGAFRETSRNNDIESRVRRAIDRVAQELLSAAESQLVPDPTGQFGTSDLAFAQVIGFDPAADEALLGPALRLAWELAPGEIDDGVDNDGDGVADQGLLVLVRGDGGANERRVVLCHGVRELLEGESADGEDDNANGVVDEAGFNVHRIGDLLYLRLSLEEPAEPEPIVRTLETSVRLRN
jgi:hypothetical protein